MRKRLATSIALAALAFVRTALVFAALGLWATHQYAGVALCLGLFWLSSEAIGWLVDPVNGVIRMCAAIETAITSEDGLDGMEGEAILREVGYWPRRAALATGVGEAHTPKEKS